MKRKRVSDAIYAIPWRYIDWVASSVFVSQHCVREPQLSRSWASGARALFAQAGGALHRSSLHSRPVPETTNPESYRFAKFGDLGFLPSPFAQPFECPSLLVVSHRACPDLDKIDL